MTEEEYINIIEWYNKQISATSKFCNKFSKIVTPDQKILGSCLLDYPKCVAKSIRQLCRCDENCISKIQKQLILNDCYLFDPISNFKSYYNTEYIKCCWPWKNREEKNKYIGHEGNTKEARKNFYDSVIDICANEQKFEVAKCSLYTFLDESPYDLDDLIKNSLLPNQEKCINVNFDSQLETFKSLINTRNIEPPLYSRNISKRETKMYSGDVESQTYKSDLSILCFVPIIILFGFILNRSLKTIRKIRTSRS